MIGRLNHVAIAVPDIAAAAKQYRDVLGASVSSVEDQPDHGVQTVFIALPNTKVELLHHRPEYRDPPSGNGGCLWGRASCRPRSIPRP